MQAAQAALAEIKRKRKKLDGKGGNGTKPKEAARQGPPDRHQRPFNALKGLSSGISIAGYFPTRNCGAV
ncbi:hypothetical protein CQ13_09340 [Bradyrhizobium retamae]|uniref:Uncharacterized protein n=1 Tax=Bradyrhizobium retamae TaxID=1300035 RepID=A0A0R3MEG8_9BRAD|nr:hypothetical protein CQ13_09340 [Bradyrhizobium retamae]